MMLMVIFAHNKNGFVVHDLLGRPKVKKTNYEGTTYLEGQYLMRTTRSSCQFMSMVERLAPAHERIFIRHKELDPA